MALIKLIGLFCRRADLTHEKFAGYYEERHVPLIRSLLPPFDGYSRSYVTDARDRERLGYDVLTEARFDSAEAFERITLAMTAPDIANEIAADEGRFMDRERSHSFMVDERS